MSVHHFWLSLDEYPSNITFIFDLETRRFVQIDHRFLTDLGLSGEDFSLDWFLSFVFAEDRVHVMRAVNKILAGITESSIEFRLNVNNETKWIRLTPFKVKNETGFMILGNAQDITSKVNNLFTVQKYANKKNSVLNVLSHDLKGNLSVLKTISQVMAKKVKDKKFTQFTEITAKVIAQSVDLINDLISREVKESVNVELVKKRIDIVVKLRDYIDEFSRAEVQSHRKFKFSASHKSIYLALDEAKFMQVMNNLMSNALKFTTENGLISLKIEQNKNTVLFRFSDNGVGISKEKQPYVFSKNGKVNNISIEEQPAVGLGLNMVKTIVELHKGNIWFESEVNKGTTFFVEIPKDQK